MPSRYVILHHQLQHGESLSECRNQRLGEHPCEHWDLMLERGEILLTWQLLKEPTGPSALPIKALKIQDHRKAYLDYEGPISGDRGCVTRIDRGTCEIPEQTPSLYVLQLTGDRFTGKFYLRNQKGHESDTWIFKTD